MICKFCDGQGSVECSPDTFCEDNCEECGGSGFTLCPVCDGEGISKFPTGRLFFECECGYENATYLTSPIVEVTCFRCDKIHTLTLTLETKYPSKRNAKP